MSYYDVLGISPQATEEDIQGAYKVRSQETIMDTEAYENVQAAYETLISAEKRSTYDAELADVEPAAVTQLSSRKTGTIPLRRSASPAAGAVEQNDVTKAFLSVVCPICFHQNSVGDKYCVECGFLLSSTPAEIPSQKTIALRPDTPRFENSIGVKFPIRPGLNRVGRENADILILDKTVSRYHALIVFDEERHLLSVEDAGSSNGTRVNDTVLTPRVSLQLNDNDAIMFGSAKLKLVAGDVPKADETEFDNVDGPKEVTITLPPSVITPTARLTLQRGRGPQEVLLVPGTINIGRLPDNHVSLSNDRFASGHHAQVVVEETVFRLIDVGSTNGSFLNGLRLTTNESIAMSDGDEVMIGSTVFQFQVIKKNPEIEDSEADHVLLEPDDPSSIEGLGE